MTPADDNEPRDPAETGEPVVVPHAELSPEALRGVIESFVLREGTDYGEREFSLEQKLAHVQGQLERREAQIVYDPNSQSIDIIPVSPRAASPGRKP